MMADISRSCDQKKKFLMEISQKGNTFLGNFDGLHMQFKNVFGEDFPKKEHFDGLYKQVT